ncbi:MAG: hypothetical protein MUC95_08810 [Spirochaetes bacterium]|jgi:hypothetical protein|nr:hypothetical protein [Spirochaetota bacterium]
MIRTELTNRSPLRILEQSTRGGVGKGNIGIIAARKGVGKTACLVHIATDMLFQGKHVLHISFSANTEHIISWYEDIFNEIAERYKLDNAMDVHDEIIRKRIIMNFNQNGVALTKVAKSVRAMIRDGNFSAESIIIDGYDLSRATVEDLKELKAMALEANLEIWFSASLADGQLQFDENGVPMVLKKIIDEVSILICLRQKDDYIHLELEKDFDIYPSSDLNLKLDPETLLIVEKA